MKLKTVAVLAAMGATALAFGAQAQDDADANGSVQALADRWTAAYNSHDEQALGALYAEDAHLYLHGLPTYQGREEITAYWADDMQVDNPLTVLTVTNSVDGIDMVLVHGNYQVLDRDTGVPLGAGRFAHIWELDENGDWLLDRDLWNQPYGEAP